MDRNRYTVASAPSNGLYSRRPTTQNGTEHHRDHRFYPYNDPYDVPTRTPPQRGDPYAAPPRDYYGTSSREPYGALQRPTWSQGPASHQRALPAVLDRAVQRPYQRRHHMGQQPSSSNPGVRGNQVFDHHGRQYTYDKCHAKKPIKVYPTNEEEFNNPQLALKFTKPYDTYEKFYQFVIDRPPNSFEQRIIKLMDSVFSQPGVRAKLILMESEEDRPLQTLQGSVDCCKSTLVLDQNEDGDHVLTIDGEEICKGKFQNKQIAKNMLGEQALEILKRNCFFIVKKPDVYEDIETDAKRKIETGPGPSPFASGSKAHTMMMKMGWAGKGLGAKEQGESRPVADIIDQNVTRRGLGLQNSKNKAAIYREIGRIFDEFKDSAKISVLRFAPDFEKEERAYIHNMALKAGLKSKSEGTAPNRRITITKKLTRDELVHSLLLIGCESALYKLLIPERFLHLWVNP